MEKYFEKDVKIRKCLKSNWALCDGNCENCRTVATTAFDRIEAFKVLERN